MKAQTALCTLHTHAHPYRGGVLCVQVMCTEHRSHILHLCVVCKVCKQQKVERRPAFDFGLVYEASAQPPRRSYSACRVPASRSAASGWRVRMAPRMAVGAVAAAAAIFQVAWRCATDPRTCSSSRPARLYALELSSERGKLTPVQAACHAALDTAGAACTQGDGSGGGNSAIRELADPARQAHMIYVLPVQFR
jgi:hypothetical protein